MAARLWEGRSRSTDEAQVHSPVAGNEGAGEGKTRRLREQLH